MQKIILNLGCGDLPIKGAINVDTKLGEYVDKVVDLRLLPWE